MFETQKEKINDANKQKNKALHEIADFLNNQFNELKNIVLVKDPDGETVNALRFEVDSDNQCLYFEIDYSW